MSSLWHALQRHALLLLSIAACLGLAFLFYTSGGQDDTYITYWPARTLAEHGQILNYNGVRLEQSSSLSFVVALAILYRLTPFSMPTVGFLASMGFGAVALALTARVARAMGLGSPGMTAPLAGTVACFAYWATSGMENTFVAATALWVIAEIAGLDGTSARGWRTWCAMFLSMLAFAASRPEAPVVLACMMLGLLLSWGAARVRSVRWMSGKSLAAVVGIAAGAVALLVAFRRLYFHAWVPNPASLKTAGFNSAEGLSYLWDSSIQSGVWILGAGVIGLLVLGFHAIRGRSAGPAPALVASLCLAQLAFIVISGGDWMSAGRFLAPAIPALVLAGMAGVASLVRSNGAVVGLSALLIATNLLQQLQFLHKGYGEGRPAWTFRSLGAMFRERFGAHEFSPIELGNKLHLRDAVTAHHLIPIVRRAEEIRQRPVWMTTGQAGMIAYHAMSASQGRAKLVDLWALTTRDLIDCIPRGERSLGKWGMWHTLQWHLDSLDRLERDCGLPKPDIYFNECISASDKKLLRDKGYVIVFNQTGDMRNSKSQKWFPGSLGACGYIAVTRELARELGLEEITTDRRWDMNPE